MCFLDRLIDSYPWGVDLQRVGYNRGLEVIYDAVGASMLAFRGRWRRNSHC
jgi:hypothetical protein